MYNLTDFPSKVGDCKGSDGVLVLDLIVMRKGTKLECRVLLLRRGCCLADGPRKSLKMTKPSETCQSKIYNTTDRVTILQAI